MSIIYQGSCLHATDLLKDFEFDNASIFIHQSDENDIVGFIINKKFPRTLNELAEFSSGKPIVLYDGGPVDREHLFFLHRRNYMIPDGRQVVGDIYFGGDFHKTIELLNTGRISENDVRIFVGYCGWDKDQLEEEIKEGSWIVAENYQLF